jgi:hypothetical protein
MSWKLTTLLKETLYLASNVVLLINLALEMY